MTRPRFRCSIDQLLFAIAIAGANCAVLRSIYDGFQVDRWIDSPGRLSVVTIVAFLPLTNVALLGVIRLLRSVRQGGRRRSAGACRWSRATISFMSAHFLILGSVVCHDRPDAVQSYVEEMRFRANELAGGRLEQLLETASVRSVELVELVLAAALVSGPAIVLSYIVSCVMRKSGHRLSHVRHWIVMGLASASFVCVGLAIVVSPQPVPRRTPVRLDFVVADAATRRPVQGAFVRIVNAFDREALGPRGLTDRLGRVQLADDFTADGQCNALRYMGSFSTWGRWLEVTAAGFQSTRIPLGEVIGMEADLARPPLAHVQLTKGVTPSAEFVEIAASYSRAPKHRRAGRRLEIEPNGRFAWVRWSCKSNQRMFGRLRRHGAEIQLVPIHRPGTETSPFVPTRYRAVRWGDRLFVCSLEDGTLQRLCRASILRPRPLFPQQINGSYVRSSDDKKPCVGMPQLPLAIWIQFVRDEFRLEDEAGTLRLVVDAVRSKIPRFLPLGSSARETVAVARGD
jgi:hypothetical protein